MTECRRPGGKRPNSLPHLSTHILSMPIPLCPQPLHAPVHSHRPAQKPLAACGGPLRGLRQQRQPRWRTGQPPHLGWGGHCHRGLSRGGAAAAGGGIRVRWCRHPQQWPGAAGVGQHCSGVPCRARQVSWDVSGRGAAQQQAVAGAVQRSSRLWRACSWLFGTAAAFETGRRTVCLLHSVGWSSSSSRHACMLTGLPGRAAGSQRRGVVTRAPCWACTSSGQRRALLCWCTR